MWQTHTRDMKRAENSGNAWVELKKKKIVFVITMGLLWRKATDTLVLPSSVEQQEPRSVLNFGATQ